MSSSGNPLEGKGAAGCDPIARMVSPGSRGKRQAKSLPHKENGRLKAYPTKKTAG